MAKRKTTTKTTAGLKAPKSTRKEPEPVHVDISGKKDPVTGTVKVKEIVTGKILKVWPVDAYELIGSGEYSLE
jgi:hypothetical protein